MDAKEKVERIAVNLQKLQETFDVKNNSLGKVEDKENSGFARTFRATIAPENNKKAEEELERHHKRNIWANGDYRTV